MSESEGAVLRAAVSEVMRHQFTHSREAMTALQVLIDEAEDAAGRIDRLLNTLSAIDRHCFDTLCTSGKGITDLVRALAFVGKLAADAIEDTET